MYENLYEPIPDTELYLKRLGTASRLFWTSPTWMLWFSPTSAGSLLKTWTSMNITVRFLWELQISTTK